LSRPPKLGKNDDSRDRERAVCDDKTEPPTALYDQFTDYLTRVPRRQALARRSLLSLRLRNDREWPHHVVVLVFEDVAVINVGLRCGDAGWQIILRADGRELSGICFDCVLESALSRIRRLHSAPMTAESWLRIVEPAAVRRLENQAISAIAAVVHEPIAAHHHI
jgi:hypothetical protein